VIPLPFEVLLPIGAFALYVFDSAMLLYGNELVFVRRRTGWDLLRSPRLFLFGRSVCFPNPLTPHVPQFRVGWSDRDERVGLDDPADIQQFIALLRPLQLIVVAQLVLLLLLPMELYIYGTGLELLILFAAYYSLIVVALAFAFARRRALNLSGRALGSLCFDCLACSPFAINLVRKLSARRGLAGNPVTFAQQAFGAASFEHFIRLLCERVHDEQQREDAQSPRWSELEAYRRKLQELPPAGAPATREVP
jgi:hypothetical protein